MRSTFLNLTLLVLTCLFSFNSNAVDTCKKAHKLIQQSLNSYQVNIFTSAFLIRPSVDTQEEALKKISSQQTYDVITVNDEIALILENNSCKNLLQLEGSGLNIVDLSGKYLMPGLHDMHIHNFGVNSDIPNSPIFSTDGNQVKHLDLPGMLPMNYRMVYAGITSHLDLMSYNRETKKLRDLQRSYNLNGRPSNYVETSNIYMTGGLFHIEAGHHGDLSWFAGKKKHSSISLSRKNIVEQKDKAKRLSALRRVLEEHISEFNPPALKVSYDHNPYRPGSPELNNMSRELLKEFIETAKSIKSEIKVICHIGTWQDIVDCLEVGASAATHLPYSSNNPNQMPPAGIFQRLKEANFSFIPTMTVYLEGGLIKNNLFNVTTTRSTCQRKEEGCKCILDVCTKISETGELTGNKHFFEDRLLQELTPQRLIDSYFDFSPYAGNKWIKWGVDHNEMGYRLRAFRQMMDAGVRVMSGTDTMWEGTFFGFSLHRELELMQMSNQEVKAPYREITQMEILQTSTSNIHGFLKHNRGRIVPNFKADFLILNSSPLDDIRNTRDIHQVVINGQIINRELLRNEKILVH